MNRQEIAVIASLFPAKLGPILRPGFTPRPEFEIAACTDPAKPQTLVVERSKEKPYMGHGKTADNSITALDLADDLVNQFSQQLGRNDTQGAFPAIWVSEGAKFVNGEWVIPQEEIKAQRLRQDGLLRNLVLFARDLHGKQDGKSILPSMHRAAEWLKIQGEPWQVELRSDARKKCSFCTATIEAQAIVCPTCHNVLDAEKYQAMKNLIARVDGTADAPPVASKLPPPPPGLKPPTQPAA